MRIKTSKSETMVLSQKWWNASEVLSVVEEFKNGVRDLQADECSSCSSVDSMLICWGGDRVEPKDKIDCLLVYLCSYLTCGHKLWVVTKRRRLLTLAAEAAELSFFWWFPGFSHRDRMRCSVIKELLILHVKICELMSLWTPPWGDVSGMSKRERRPQDRS